MSRTHTELPPDPPAGTRVVVNRGEGVRGSFCILRAGRSLPDIIGIAVAALWIALVGWATWNAVQASWWLALVSAPFWLVGLVVAHQILRSLSEKQKILLQADHLEIVKESVVGNSRVAIGYADVEEVGVEKEVPLNPTTTFRFMNRTEKEGRAKRAVPHLVIRHRARKSFVAEHLSESEMEWLGEALKQVVREAGRGGDGESRGGGRQA